MKQLGVIIRVWPTRKSARNFKTVGHWIQTPQEIPTRAVVNIKPPDFQTNNDCFRNCLLYHKYKYKPSILIIVKEFSKTI
jgi:hypothetical protein